jgi:regulator of nucleoside diphosphate kinase
MGQPYRVKIMKDPNRITETRLAKPPLIIDAGHYERLIALAMRWMKQAPELAQQLLDEVERARVLPSEDMPADVVTIGSQVTFRDEGTGAVDTVQVVLPHDASIDERRVSVLAPIGAALIGLSVGQRIDWQVVDGRMRRLSVLEVSQRSKGRGDVVRH